LGPLYGPVCRVGLVLKRKITGTGFYRGGGDTLNVAQQTTPKRWNELEALTPTKYVIPWTSFFIDPATDL